MRPTLLHLATIALLFAEALPLAHPEDPSYAKSIAQWRQNYEAGLKADNGWLTVSGLFWLHEGENRFGSDPADEIVLPAGSVPAQAGSFIYRNRKVTVQIKSGVPVTLNGKPVQSAELLPDSQSDQLHLGDLTLYVHASGERLAIRLRDKNSALRKQFTGLHWFPVNESYRLQARWTPYNPPKPAQIENILGDFDRGEILGYASFPLGGHEYRLEATQDEPGKLFFVFRDLTSGKETYPAARFLDTDMPRDGALVLDFNQAYNPPCAYNPYTTCPLPSPQNRLRVEIPAGEKIYNREHAR